MRSVLLSRSDLRSLMLVLALSTALFLPFLNQAVHMDDSIYLDVARNVLKNPLHPHDFPYCFEGYCAPDMASHSHPPFVAYWLAAWLWLSGGSVTEWALHAAYLPFVWLFACSAFLLAKRFSRRPLLYSLIAVSSPVAVVMSHNLMADYPNLAFWTAALALFTVGVDHRRPLWIWTSSLFMVLSAFTSYPSLIVPLLCWSYAAQRRAAMRAAIWAPAVPFLWMGLWLGYSSAYFGRFILSGTGRYFVEDRGMWTFAMLADKFLAFPVFLAGTVAVPWNWIGQASRWMSGRIVILAILVSAAITQLGVPAYAFPEKVLFGCLFGVGILAIVALAASLLMPAECRGLSDDERKDRNFLLLWMGAVSFLVLFLNAAASARYLMPLVVPFVLLSGGRHFQISTRSRSAAPVWTLILGITWALGLSLADYQAAATPKSLVEEIKKDFRGWENRVRFGAEWGLRHYLQENGFRQFISTSDDFQGADFILMPEVAIPYMLPQDVASMSFVVSQKSHGTNFPIRLMSRKAHAGFYSSGWGLLPFSFSNAPLETIKILQVAMLVEKLPEIRLGEGPNAHAALPLRGTEGQVDLQLPVPFELIIPYSGPAASVLYKWCQLPSLEVQQKSGSSPDFEPVFTASTHTSLGEQPLVIQPSGSWERWKQGWIRGYRIQVPALSHGEIRFKASLIDSSTTERAILRNWCVLPRTLRDSAP